MRVFSLWLFFFQAEDGIRDIGVTGVQTCALPICTCGCAGYRLGPLNGLAAGEKSVQVVPFSNQTLEPRLGDAVTAQLRKVLQKDATFQLATHDDGAIVVSGIITGYNRFEESFVAS